MTNGIENNCYHQRTLEHQAHKISIRIAIHYLVITYTHVGHRDRGGTKKHNRPTSVQYKLCTSNFERSILNSTMRRLYTCHIQRNHSAYHTAATCKSYSCQKCDWVTVTLIHKPISL